MITGLEYSEDFLIIDRGKVKLKATLRYVSLYCKTNQMPCVDTILHFNTKKKNTKCKCNLLSPYTVTKRIHYSYKFDIRSYLSEVHK